MACYICSNNEVSAQQIELKYTNQKLNEVLNQIGKNYDLAFSFDDLLLSKYRITLDTNFYSVQQSIKYLIKGLPIEVVRYDSVYVFYSRSNPERNNRDSLFISATVYDLKTYEPLPYASILINKTFKYTNNSGRFSYMNKHSDSLKIMVSYIGYRSLDTIVAVNDYKHDLELFLSPNQVDLKEVVVWHNNFEQPIIGKETGKIKANTQIAKYLPGVGDNTLFQFLGMMPGIQSAGNSSGGMSIWGGNAENTYYEFDGMRIYNANHFFGNIGKINQLTIKNIQITKGIGAANEFNSASGSVKISGKIGNRVKPSITAELNNLTANILFETPASSSNTFLIAARGLYRNPQNTVYFNSFSDNVSSIDQPSNLPSFLNIDVDSKYLFGDIQLKFSGANGSKNNYYINLYQSIDISSFETDTLGKPIDIYSSDLKRWGNTGAVFHYNENWDAHFSSEITTGLSSYFEEKYSLFNALDSVNLNSVNHKNDEFDQLWDYSIKNTNTLELKKGHLLHFGLGGNFYYLLYNSTVNDTVSIADHQSAIIPYVFLQDRFQLNKWLNIDAGIRYSYSSLVNKLFASPNITLTYDVLPNLSMGLNAGISQNAFLKPMLAFNGIEGDANNFFRLANKTSIPIEQTNLLASSVNFSLPKYQLSIEAYYKNQLNTTEYVPIVDIPGNDSFGEGMFSKSLEQGFYSGTINSKGITFYNRFILNELSLWQTYSYTDSRKIFPDIYGDTPVPNVNSMKHEIKLAGIYHINNIAFSSTYTYGSGYPYNSFIIDRLNQAPQKQLTQNPYNRLDCSITYEIRFKRLKIKTGVSVLNVLNIDNQQYQKLGTGGLTSNYYYQISSLPRVLSSYVHISL